MYLVIGGAYQGKTDFAKEKFNLSDEDIYFCIGEENEIIDFSKRCICNIEKFVYKHPNAEDVFEAHKEEWKNSVFICRDIFCGVVPIDAEVRAWRHNTGLLCRYFTKNAEGVSRIFCGLEQKLK